MYSCIVVYPSRRRFSYHFTAATPLVSARALAVGDLDCDTTKITYTLDLSANGGQLISTLIEPAPGAD